MVSESKAWGPAGMGVPPFGCGRTSTINIFSLFVVLPRDVGRKSQQGRVREEIYRLALR